MDNAGKQWVSTWGLGHPGICSLYIKYLGNILTVLEFTTREISPCTGRGQGGGGCIVCLPSPSFNESI